MMGVSGVASSCERFCMNSVLARAAALVLALHFLALALEECAQLAGELLYVDGLLDVAVAADGEREAAVAVRGEHHDGALIEPLVRAQPCRGLVAVEAGELDVAEDEIGMRGDGEIDARHAVGGLEHVE